MVVAGGGVGAALGGGGVSLGVSEDVGALVSEDVGALVSEDVGALDEGGGGAGVCVETGGGTMTVPAVIVTDAALIVIAALLGRLVSDDGPQPGQPRRPPHPARTSRSHGAHFIASAEQTKHLGAAARLRSGRCSESRDDTQRIRSSAGCAPPAGSESSSSSRTNASRP